MKFIRILPLAALLLALAACIEETIQVENLSKDIAYERQIAIPVLKAALTFEEIAGDYDSLIIGVGDTIFLYLNQDIGFHDTMNMTEFGDAIDFELLNVHYEITNMFPVGLDMKIYLYDSVTALNIDTIWFSETPGDLFIEPAPVDENGLAIIDEVQTTNSFIALDEGIFSNLFGNTTQLILDATVPSTGGFIKVLKVDRLDMNLGIEARGRFVTSIDSLFNFN
jgi:hypothetical protein